MSRVSRIAYCELNTQYTSRTTQDEMRRSLKFKRNLGQRRKTVMQNRTQKFISRNVRRMKKQRNNGKDYYSKENDVWKRKKKKIKNRNTGCYEIFLPACGY